MPVVERTVAGGLAASFIGISQGAIIQPTGLFEHVKDISSGVVHTLWNKGCKEVGLYGLSQWNIAFRINIDDRFGGCAELSGIEKIEFYVGNHIGRQTFQKGVQ